jgi:anti-anti-sigma factor
VEVLMSWLSTISEFLGEYYSTCGLSYVGVEPTQSKELFERMLQRASEDARFREELMLAPEKALSASGFKLPSGFHVKFVEETEDTVFLPIAPYVGELPDADSTNTGLQQVIRRAVTDLEFRKRLVTAPRAVLMEAGMDMPADKSVVVVESTDDTFYVILPPLRSEAKPSPHRFSFVAKGGRTLLRGRLDSTSVAEVRDELLALEGNLVLDLGGLTYISSAGLGILLMLLKKLKKKGHTVRLVNLQPPVRNVFVLTGFDSVFGV